MIIEFPTGADAIVAMRDALRDWREQYYRDNRDNPMPIVIPPPIDRRIMPDMNQAGSSANLIDGVTNNIDAHVEQIGGLVQNLRAFCDSVLGPEAPNPPSREDANRVMPPDTRGTKLIKSTERLAATARDLNNQILRLGRI